MMPPSLPNVTDDMPHRETPFLISSFDLWGATLEQASVSEGAEKTETALIDAWIRISRNESIGPWLQSFVNVTIKVSVQHSDSQFWLDVSARYTFRIHFAPAYEALSANDGFLREILFDSVWHRFADLFYLLTSQANVVVGRLPRRPSITLDLQAIS